MPLRIEYRGTQKEKEVMEKWIRPIRKGDPLEGFDHLNYFLDLIILGEEHYRNRNTNKLEDIDVIAEPLLIDGKYAGFKGQEGEIYKRDYDVKDLESNPFIISIKPKKGNLSYHGATMGKLATFKADQEAVSFRSRNMLIKMFYRPDSDKN